ESEVNEAPLDILMGPPLEATGPSTVTTPVETIVSAPPLVLIAPDGISTEVPSTVRVPVAFMVPLMTTAPGIRVLLSGVVVRVLMLMVVPLNVAPAERVKP